MSKKKKKATANANASQNGGLVEQARQVVEGAVQDLQKRLPPDLVKQLERSIGQGQKTLQSGIQRVQTDVRKTARQADIDKLTRRVDGLAKQLQQLEKAFTRSSGGTAGTARRSASGSRSSSRSSTSRSSSARPSSSRTSSKSGSSSRRPGSTPRTGQTQPVAPTKPPVPPGEGASPA